MQLKICTHPQPTVITLERQAPGTPQLSTVIQADLSEEHLTTTLTETPTLTVDPVMFTNGITLETHGTLPMPTTLAKIPNGLTVLS